MIELCLAVESYVSSTYVQFQHKCFSCANTDELLWTLFCRMNTEWAEKNDVKTRSIFVE